MKNSIQLDEVVVQPSNFLRVGNLNLMAVKSLMNERVTALIEDVKDKEFDVLCLQEVLTDPEFNIIEKLKNSLGFKSAYSSSGFVNPDGNNQSNVILTKTDNATSLPPLSIFIENSASHKEYLAIVAETSYNGAKVYIINAHLAWGGDAEWVRLRQAELINDYAVKLKKLSPDSVVLFTGDFNAVESSSTLRYLYGQQEGTHNNGTVWSDAWKMFGSGKNEITSDPETIWGKETAKKTYEGAISSLTPKRRIDYILSYGWTYGKLGSPLSFHKFADKPNHDSLEISDHHGIYSDIYIP